MLPICREKQLQLNQQFQQNTLPHAIILQGIAGAGKDVLAKWLIELLICQTPKLVTHDPVNDVGISHACEQCKACLLRQSKSYPDHLHLASDTKSLGVDDIRRGNAFLEKTAHLGLIKTILIPQAETMTVAAANALLKTLEEPSPNSFIVLLADELDTLLPTIVSRCAVYAIRPMIGEALLAQLNVSQQSASYPSRNTMQSTSKNTAFINLSQLPELTDESVLQQFEQFSRYYDDYLSSTTNENTLLSSLVDNIHGFRWLEKITCNHIRQYYLSQGSSSIEVSVEVLNNIYQAIISSNKLIKSYPQTNRQYVAEQLVMTIDNIVRPST
jgi:DNA polymerase-3 subunit delta'